MPLFSYYNDTADISPKLIIPALVFLILTPIIVGLRLLANLHYGKLPSIDDCLIIVSLVCVEILGVLLLLCGHFAFGKHESEMTVSVLQKSMELFLFAQMAYKLSLAFTKLSILFFYERLFRPHRAFVMACRTISVIVAVWSLVTFFTTLFQCIPIDHSWKATPNSSGGTCINLKASWYANSAFSILTDTVIVFLPVWCVWKLQVPVKKKLFICGLFAVGIVVIVCSILRATTISGSTGRDRTWDEVQSCAWSICEANTAIIGACLPSFSGHVKNFFVKCRKLATRSTNTRSANSRTPNNRSTYSRQFDNDFGGVFTGNHEAPRTVITSDAVIERGPKKWIRKLRGKVAPGVSIGSETDIVKSTQIKQTVELVNVGDGEHRRAIDPFETF